MELLSDELIIKLFTECTKVSDYFKLRAINKKFYDISEDFQVIRNMKILEFDVESEKIINILSGKNIFFMKTFYPKLDIKFKEFKHDMLNPFQVLPFYLICIDHNNINSRLGFFKIVMDYGIRDMFNAIIDKKFLEDKKFLKYVSPFLSYNFPDFEPAKYIYDNSSDNVKKAIENDSYEFDEPIKYFKNISLTQGNFEIMSEWILELCEQENLTNYYQRVIYCILYYFSKNTIHKRHWQGIAVAIFYLVSLLSDENFRFEDCIYFCNDIYSDNDMMSFIEYAFASYLPMFVKFPKQFSNEELINVNIFSHQ
jgi:hypothetical protein